MDKRLFLYEGSKRLMIVIGILTAFQSAAIIIQAIFLAKAIVQMYNGAAWTAVLSSFAVFLLAVITRQFMQWAKSRAAYIFADKTASKYEDLLMRKIFDIGPKAVGKHGSGHLVTLCLEGIASFRTYLELFIPRFIGMMLIPWIILFYVFTMDAASGAVLTVVLPILIAFLILLGLAAKKQKDAKWESYQMLSRHFVDSLRGLVTLKFLGKSKSHKDAIWTVSNKYRIATNRTLRVAFLSTFSLDFFASLSVAVVAVELGLRLINGTIGFEPALTILILAPEYFMPVRELGNDYHATMDGKEAGEKVHAILSEKTIDNPSEKIEMERWNENSELKISGIHQKSEEENLELLHDVSFQVKGFKKVGVIGLSGAGKSTLIDILAGFASPTSGEIEIAGKRIENLALPAWRQQVTYIPQHPYIFSGTIRENITWYARDASLEKIEEAIAIAGLKELVDSLPNELDERVGQGGRFLSGGEEQRIAIARGFLAEKPIMLFDEPTAHLDIETEHEIKQRMLYVMEGKLVFFATHRLHWMKNMDYIIVLDNGRLIEAGTEAELLAKKGAYCRLAEAHRGGKQSAAV